VFTSFSYFVAQVKEKLQTAVGLAITTDGWQSIAVHSYAAITAHWLDDDFRMQRSMLGVERMLGSHTHQNIGDMLVRVLDSFGIRDKAFHFTTDNAENWVKAITEVVGGLHSRCFAHTLQLLVNKALEKHEKLISDVRGVVTVFSHSTAKVEQLEASQLLCGLPKKRLSTDVVTRWQSKYDMCKDVFENQRALEMGELVPLDKRLSATAWAQLAELVAGLKPYREVTDALQAEKYPTLNLLLPSWFLLIEDAEDYAKTRCVRGKLADELIKEMDRRSAKISSRATLMACLLDPRLRQLRFLDSDEDADQQKQHAIDALREEFAAEQARMAVEKVGEEKGEQARIALEKVGEEKGVERKYPEHELDEKHVGGDETKAEREVTKHKDSEKEKRDSAGKNKRKADDGGSGSGSALHKRFCERALKKYADRPGAEIIRDEVAQYLAQPAVGVAKDPLEWWRMHKSLFPVLARLARKFLCIPATSAPVERVWSTAGNVVTRRRARLSDDLVDSIVFCHENIECCLDAAVEIEDAASVRAKQKAAVKR
jgi:hypothetical protein